MIRTFGVDAPGPEFVAEIVIIGTGAMGLAMASEFLGKGLQVLLLEAGAAAPTSASDSHYETDIVGHPFNGSTSGRRRVFGGSTTLWGGQFLPLGDIVFEDRPWLGVSGWPIDKSELSPYFVRAAAVGRLNSHTGDESIWRENGIEPPAFDADELFSEFSRWSPSPNFASNYRAVLAESEDVDVLLDATVAELRLEAEGGRLSEVVIKSSQGAVGKVTAKAYVLAAGAIESARILLASNAQDERGVGNRSGNVGRYYQDHVVVPAANVVPTDRAAFHRLYDNFILGNTKYAPKITLSDVAQREDGLLNVGGFFRFPSGGEEGVQALKTLVFHLKRRTKPENLAGLTGAALSNLPSVMRFLYGIKFKNRIQASHKGPIVLEAHAEQLPSPNSRVLLSKDRDALGMSRAAIDWQIDDASRKAARRFVETVRGELSRLGIADVQPFREPLDNPKAFQATASDVYHQMGTLRMSQDPVDGVVDSNCRMHEVENLYVAGCSVFPVSGYSNPTFTALALALRLGDHLRSKL